MRVTRLDSYDNHHRRKGEEDREGIRHQEQEPNDIDKKTRPTTSTRTSSIIHHIVTCAISHGSKATTTCLCGINDIISFILDYLDSSRSGNGQHQSINIKQQRQTDNINIKQKTWLNIKDPQHLHIKVLQQNNIKPFCRTSWPPNGQNNINIISLEHGWRMLPAMKVSRARSSTTILKLRR